MDDSKYATIGRRKPDVFNTRRRNSPPLVLNDSQSSRSNANGPANVNGQSSAASLNTASHGNHDALANLNKLVLRLHWKTHLLFSSHAHTTALCSQPSTDEGTDRDSLGSKAQQMFRLDFFEFYVLFERAVVLALALCGVRVSAMRNSPTQSPSRSPNRASQPSSHASQAEEPLEKRFIFATRGHTVITPSRAATSSTLKVVASTKDERRIESGGAQHRFHANVLRALEREGSPLREALGMGDARDAVVRAKALRNAWKDESLEPANDAARDGSAVGFIGTQELEGMLNAIMGGVDLAEAIARDRVNKGEIADVGDAGVMDWEYMIEDGWNVQADPMDLE